MSREAVELVLRAVRPSMQSDDGSLDLVVAEGTMARVRLTGLCDRCPGAVAVLTGGLHSADAQIPSHGVSLDERLAEYEASLIARALRLSHGNKSRAAALLHIKRTTLADRINRHRARLRELAGERASDLVTVPERRA